MLFDLYVGSTDAHSAHTDTDLIVGYATRVGLPEPRVQHVWGVWDGMTEDVAQYTFDLPSDALAQRVATALAALTGNDAVLVTRLSTDRDAPAGGFGNLSGYRVRTETRSHGNRTLLSDPFDAVHVGDRVEFTWSISPAAVTRRGTIAGWAQFPGLGEFRFTRHDVDYSAYSLPGFAYVPDREGSHVAYLVTGAGTVSSVTANPTADFARTEEGGGSDVSAGQPLTD